MVCRAFKVLEMEFNMEVSSTVSVIQNSTLRERNWAKGCKEYIQLRGVAGLGLYGLRIEGERIFYRRFRDPGYGFTVRR